MSIAPDRRAVALAAAFAVTGCRAPVRELDATHSLACSTQSPRIQPVSVGAFLGDEAKDGGSMTRAIAAYAVRAGELPAMVKVYENLGDPLGPGTRAGQRIAAIVAAHAIPLISLEPTWPGGTSSDIMERIAAGAADSLIVSRARELGLFSFPQSVIVELASEMNARFGAPWQPPESAAGDSSDRFAATYIAAWRRVVATFRAASAARVRWLWAVSTGNPYTHAASGGPHWNWYDRYYPGDDVVDAVGLHAFNDPESQDAWIPFVELVDGQAADHVLSSLAERHPGKPLLISELATAERPRDPGAKAAWINDAFTSIARCAPIRAVVWFDARKERDWRLDSSPQSQAAYRAVLAAIRTTAARTPPRV